MEELISWLENHKDVCVSVAYFSSEYLKITMGYKYWDIDRMIWKKELDVVNDMKCFLSAILDSMYHELKSF